MEFIKFSKNLLYKNKLLFYFCKRYNQNSTLLQSNHLSIKHKISESINIPELYKYLAIRFNSVNLLKENLASRKQRNDIDDLHQKFINLQILFDKKLELEYLKFENAKLIGDIGTKGSTLMNLEIDKIKNQGRKIKEDLKKLLNGPDGYRIIESSLLPELLSLPVDLDPLTPKDYVTIHEEKPDDNNKKYVEHIELSKDDLSFCHLQANSNSLLMHYLNNNLSKLEIHVTRWLQRFIKLNSSYSHLMCPDMVKKYIAECCEKETSELLSLDTDKKDPNHDLVLTGNSLSTYLSYLISLGDHIDSTNKFYRIGSSYKSEDTNKFGLYKVSQNMQLDIFSASVDELNSKILFEESVTLLKNLHSSFHLPYKLVVVPAFDLLNFESIRVDAYLWSPAHRQYIKSGFIRSCKDIFSRSFELKYKNQYLYMVHGVLIKVPVLLASIIENQQNASFETLKEILK